MRPISIVCVSCSVVALCFLATCGFGSDDDEDGPLGGSHSVVGKVVDVQSGAEVTASTLSTSGLVTAAKVELDGSAFSLEGIPSQSAFQLLATAPPTYRATFSPAVTVEEDDVEEIAAPLVSEAFLAELSAAFTVTPSAARGILLARVVDGEGKPRAGVPSSSFAIQGAGITPPKFLNDAMAAAPAAAATSASGWVVFFEVPPGVVSLTQSATSTVGLEMATAPINAATVTVAEIRVTDGAPPKFSNVSFSQQVMPIFSGRGCVACHSGGGPGKDLGGLTLTGPADKVYKELLQEDPTRVRAGMPEQSLLLTMPSRESPADRHPNVTFASAADLDFQKIYVWIKEGAKEN